eukprot:COSAG06_NODE_4715_length_4014_cov_42.572158_2_plen_94_part_00
MAFLTSFALASALRSSCSDGSSTTEYAAIKAEYAAIKAEYAAIKAEYAAIKAETAAIKAENDLQRRVVRRHDRPLSTLINQLNHTSKRLNRLK